MVCGGSVCWKRLSSHHATTPASATTIAKTTSVTAKAPLKAYAASVRTPGVLGLPPVADGAQQQGGEQDLPTPEAVGEHARGDDGGGEDKGADPRGKGRERAHVQGLAGGEQCPRSGRDSLSPDSAQGRAKPAEALLHLAEGGSDAVTLLVVKSGEHPASQERGHGDPLRRCEG